MYSRAAADDDEDDFRPSFEEDLALMEQMELESQNDTDFQDSPDQVFKITRLENKEVF